MVTMISKIPLQEILVLAEKMILNCGEPLDNHAWTSNHVGDEYSHDNWPKAIKINGASPATAPRKSA